MLFLMCNLLAFPPVISRQAACGLCFSTPAPPFIHTPPPPPTPLSRGWGREVYHIIMQICVFCRIVGMMFIVEYFLRKKNLSMRCWGGVGIHRCFKPGCVRRGAQRTNIQEIGLLLPPNISFRSRSSVCLPRTAPPRPDR